MISPQLGFVLLFVKDPAESAAFYENILGIKPIEQSPTFALFALKNGVMLGLWLHKTAEPKVTASAGAMEIAFSDQDVDNVYKEWSQLGIPMAQVPTHMDFGYTFVALDSDGHRIRVYKLKEE